MLEIMERNRNKIDIDTMSPLIWAYAGDSVYELYIRSHLIDNTKQKPHWLHVKTIKYVKASEQAKILKELKLTDEEKEIVRRARNTENHHLPKNADPEDYMYATAFEALIGYLYLTKNDDRLEEILKKAISIVHTEF